MFGRQRLTPPSCEKLIIVPIPTARFIVPAQLSAIQAVTAGEMGYNPPVVRNTPKSVTPGRCGYLTLTIMMIKPSSAIRFNSRTVSILC